MNSALIVQQLVALAEADLTCHGNGYPGRSGGKKITGLCGEASLTVRYFAHKNGLDVQMYQTKDVHKYFCGEALASKVGDQTFAHGFNIAVINNEPFLIDITFGQFCDGATVQQGETLDTGIPSKCPLAMQLIRDGYAPLTQEILHDYLRLTSCNMGVDRGYINGATVGDLLHSAPVVDMQFLEAEIASGETWHSTGETQLAADKLPKTCAEQSTPCLRPDPIIPNLGDSGALRAKPL